MNERYTQQMIIVPSICDGSGRLSYHDTFAVFQDIASVHAQRMGLGLYEMQQKDLYWLTVRTKIRFLHRPAMMREVTASTWPDAPGKVRCNRSYLLEQDGEPLVAGKTEWATVNTKTGKLELMTDLYHCDPAPLSLDEPFARIPDSFEEVPVYGSYVVRSTDIDVGGHMNNAAYVRAVMSSFSGKEILGIRIRTMDVVFRNSCFEGETLLLQKKQTENGIDLRASREDGTTILLARVETD